MGLLPALIGLGGTLLSRKSSPNANGNTTEALNSAQVGQTATRATGSEATTNTGVSNTASTNTTATDVTNTGAVRDIATSLGQALTQNQSATTDRGTNTQTSSGTVTNREAGSMTGTNTSIGFEAGVMNNLNQLLSSAIDGTQFTAGQGAVAGQLGRVNASAAGPGFDPTAYARGITDAASSRINSDLEMNVNAIESASGGSERGNTMIALLGNKMRGEAAAQLAGITSEATAAGRQIANQEMESKSGQIAQLQQAGASNLSNLIGVLAGNQQTTTTNQQTANTAQQDSLQQALNEILNTSNTAATGSETTNNQSTNNQTSSNTSQTRGSASSNETQNVVNTGATSTSASSVSNETSLESGNNANTAALFKQLQSLFAASRVA